MSPLDYIEVNIIIAAVGAVGFGFALRLIICIIDAIIKGDQHDHEI